MTVVMLGGAVVGTVLGEIEVGLLVLMVAVFGGLGLLSLALTGQGGRRAEVYGSRVEIHGLLSRRVIPFDTITDVEHHQALYIHTTSGRVRVALATRNAQAMLYEALQERADSLRDLTRRRQEQRLPISIAKSPGVILTNTLMGLAFGPGMMLLGVLAAWMTVQDWSDKSLSESLASGGMSVLWLLFGALLGWMIFGLFVRRYTFTAEHIVIHHLLWARTIPVSTLVSIDLRSETRTTKGVERTAWFIALTQTGEKVEKIELSENGFPIEWSAAADHHALSALCQQLKKNYRL